MPFRGLHAHKVRITYKKAGDGFLVYALCDKPGYVFDFSFHLLGQYVETRRLKSILLDLIERMLAVQPTYEYGVLLWTIYTDPCRWLAHVCNARSILLPPHGRIEYLLR